jgi:hypothetical protein
VHSVEQSQDFHVVRRVAALVAPGWRLFATPRLEAGAVALDLTRRTIELGEGTGAVELVAYAMFGLGQIRQQQRVRFNEFFGRGLRGWKGTDEELLNTLANQGVLADRDALGWARRALDAFWPATDFSGALKNCAWQYNDWVRYFSST